MIVSLQALKKGLTELLLFKADGVVVKHPLIENPQTALELLVTSDMLSQSAEITGASVLPNLKFAVLD